LNGLSPLAGGLLERESTLIETENLVKEEERILISSVNEDKAFDIIDVLNQWQKKSRASVAQLSLAHCYIKKSGNNRNCRSKKNQSINR
jgi:aryl-alcohol dehydrogenase-like predicted oxidoreductase